MTSSPEHRNADGGATLTFSGEGHEPVTLTEEQFERVAKGLATESAP